MKTIIQVTAIGCFSMLAAVATWWTAGPPIRELPCDPSTLKEGEICLADIPKDRNIVWIDARSRSDWQRNGLPGSLLWNLNPDEDIHEMEANVAMQLMTTPYAVIYCGDENCGTSHKIADLIRDIGLDAEVQVLFGGWSSLQQAGLTPGSPNQTR